MKKRMILLVGLLLALFAWGATISNAAVLTYYTSKDSLAGGDSLTLGPINVAGARRVYIHWGHRDSTGFTNVYVDSFQTNSTGLRVSMDGTNYTWPATAAQNSASGFIVTPVPLASTTACGCTGNPSAQVGCGRLSTMLANPVNSGTAFNDQLGVRYIKLTAVAYSRPRCPTTSACPGGISAASTSMYRPFIKVYVVNDNVSPGNYYPNTGGH